VIYLDTAYIAKCYLNEPGADRVRSLARDARGLASSELARLELACTVHRHVREGHLAPREAREALADFHADERADVWKWLPVTPFLLGKASDEVASLPARPLLRAVDVLHLVTAREHGFREVYTNDRHMLDGARYFGLTGVNVLAR
jgi:predicted nucleic acid-binding protein